MDGAGFTRTTFTIQQVCYCDIHLTVVRQKLEQMHERPGENIDAGMAPDNKQFSVVAGGGYRAGTTGQNGYTIPAFEVDDISKVHTVFKTGPYLNPDGLSSFGTDYCCLWGEKSFCL